MSSLIAVRVHLRSQPGFWAQYDGHVDVRVLCIEDAFAAAIKKLASTSFPDRPSLNSWVHERSEVLA